MNQSVVISLSDFKPDILWYLDQFLVASGKETSITFLPGVSSGSFFSGTGSAVGSHDPFWGRYIYNPWKDWVSDLGFRVYHGLSWFLMVYHGLSQLKFRMGSNPFSVIIPLGSSHRKSNQQPCPTNGVRIGSINCRQSTYLQLHPSVPNNLSDPIVKYIPCFILSIYTGICIIYIYILYTHMLYLHTKHCSSGHLRHAGDILLAGRCRQDGACEGLVKPGNDPLYGVKSKPNPL